MVLVVHAMARTLRVHGGAVHHAALAHREVGDVDHLLHFAVALGLDLAHLQRNQRTQGVLVLAQRFAAQAHRFAALRCRRGAPHLERRLRTLDDHFVIGRAGCMHGAEHLARGRVHRLQRTGVGGLGPFALTEIRAGLLAIEAKRGEDCVGHGCLLNLRAWGRRGEGGKLCILAGRPPLPDRSRPDRVAAGSMRKSRRCPRSSVG